MKTRLFHLASALLAGAMLLPGGACGDSPAAPEEVLFSLTTREKVGQLFVIRPDQLLTSISERSIHDSRERGALSLTDEMRAVLEAYPAGGFAQFGKNIDTPEQLAAFNAQLAAACRIPPILAVDEEGGRVARLANAFPSLPQVGSAASMGATGKTEAARRAGAAIGEYLARFGFTLDFAPVADVNSNPQNSVVGDRSFGSDPALVTRMAAAYIDGLHEHGVGATVKHFPGHGDTSADTHLGYVAVHKTWEQLLETELIPFMGTMDKTDAIMVAHITLPQVTDDGLPATLSRQLIEGRLRGELGYDGLVITDALAMGAIEQTYTSAEAAVLAFLAGNDILLMPQSYTEAFEGVLAAVEDGRIPMARLDESVLRILRFKLRAR